MQDSNAWSVNLGRWSGIRVRLHALFMLFAVFTLYLGSRTDDTQLFWYGVLCLAVLFVSVLLHELAHCYAAVRVGGHADEIVIGPFGGLAQVTVPHEPQSEVITALAGPAVNLAIWCLTVPLLMLTSDVSVLGLLNPLRPNAVVEGPPQEVFLKLTCWLNWVLVLVNLLPAFPFDGGRALRALLWPVFGYRTAIVAVANVARVAALALCLIAWLMASSFQSALVPAWVPLVLIAMFLFFSAQQEVARSGQPEGGEEPFGYDFSQGYTSLERNQEPSGEEPGLMRRWLEKRREERDRLAREQEAAEESRVDEILARLHGQGMEGLSAEDRALLNRVAARYRNRLKQ